MIEQDVFDAFNNKLLANVNDIKKMSPAQWDSVKSTGSAAENMLKNRDFILFVRQFQLETMDALTEIRGHDVIDNNQRVALSNQLVGMENFINVLKRARNLKDRVVTEQAKAEQPNT